MEVDDHDFAVAVKALQKLAREGAPMKSLLEHARNEVALRSTPAHALMAFFRAFDIPLSAATSLGRWVEFNAPNPGVSAEDLEAEFGELLRSRVRGSCSAPANPDDEKEPK